MTKLHSFTILILFLNFGHLGCGGDNDAQTHGSAQSGESKKDGGSAHEHDAMDAHSGGVGGHDNGSFPADGAAAGSGTDSSGGTGGAGGAGTESAESAAPGTFTHIYEMAFRTCRTQCHGMGFSMLDMSTRDMAYSQLVDHDTNPGNMKCAPLGLKRVKPGSPDESLLYLKLDINPPCGQQMPPGGKLADALRDEVRDWIMNGAQDD